MWWKLRSDKVGIGHVSVCVAHHLISERRCRPWFITFLQGGPSRGGGINLVG